MSPRGLSELGILDGVRASAGCTDYLEGIPDYVEHHVEDVTVRFTSAENNPDDFFSESE